MLKKVKKPLLITTTAFLTFYPLCLAEAATSYALQRPSQPRLQTTSETLHRNLPRTNLSQSLSALGAPSLDYLKSTLSDYQAQLRTLTPNVADKTRLQPLQEAITLLQSQIDKAETLDDVYNQSLLTLQQAVKRYEQAQEARVQAEEAHTTATQARLTADTAYQEAQAKEQAALIKLNEARTASIQASSTLQTASAELQTISELTETAFTALNTARDTAEAASNNKTIAESNRQIAESSLNAALDALDAAQTAYDTNLIPDPTWTHPTEQVAHTRLVEHTRQVPVTTLVPHTTYTTTGGVKAEVFNRLGYNNAPPLPTANETPISTQTVTHIDFRWDYILNSGRNEDVIVRFTGFFTPPTTGTYYFYTPADDGTQLTFNNQLLINDWYDKGGGGSTSQAVQLTAGTPYPFTLYYYENGGGASVSFYYYNPNTSYGYQLVPAAWLGQQVEETTTYTEETTYVTETYYTEETYYTTEPVQYVEKTIEVQINEGGQATFTAPAGATFISSNLRYEAKDRPECGVNIYPQVNGLNQVTIQASNGVWGDPCGGWYKHVVGTLTYTGTPTAPLIHDPELLTILEQKQQDYAAALQTFNEADSVFKDKQSTYESANQQLTAAQANYDDALSSKVTAVATHTSAETNSEAASIKLTEEETAHLATIDELETAETAFTTASTESARTSGLLEAATLNEASSKESVRTAEATSDTSLSTYATQLKSAESTTTKVDALLETTKPDPEPEPPVEEGSKEIPAELSAENLMEVNLDAVDPTELTPEQAEQLVEAALETFETAEVGSAEYEQALDALYLAAEQDDIVLDPALAVIPGLAAATELINFLGNAGADMSPKVREESKKVVVTAVVAAGAAIQSAAAAASMSSASTRKIGN